MTCGHAQSYTANCMHCYLVACYSTYGKVDSQIIITTHITPTVLPQLSSS